MDNKVIRIGATGLQFNACEQCPCGQWGAVSTPFDTVEDAQALLTDLGMGLLGRYDRRISGWQQGQRVTGWTEIYEHPSGAQVDLYYTTVYTPAQPWGMTA